MPQGDYLHILKENLVWIESQMGCEFLILGLDG